MEKKYCYIRYEPVIKYVTKEQFETLKARMRQSRKIPGWWFRLASIMVEQLFDEEEDKTNEILRK